MSRFTSFYSRLRGWAWTLLLVAVSPLALSSLTMPSLAAAADEKSADLPLKKVVMFSSGVGYYERRGQVSEDAKIELQFNARDVNDLLKSMVLQDLDGGRISTVTYGSKDPITKTLKSFAIDLTANPTLAQLLNQVRGEKIEVEAPDPIAGTIVGIEKRKQPVGKDDVVEVEYLNLLTDKGLRSVSLANVGRIKLSNDKLDAELRQALLVLASGHATDKKSVTLDFLGKGKRNVRVGYVHEAPIWKTSYRLVIRDKEAPLLQGWAIVENTTDADWNGVDLTLISGRPISFVMDLYQPLYLPRPVVEPELFASLRPPTYDQDMAGKDADFRRAARPADKSRQLASEARGGGGGFGGVGGPASERGRGEESFAYAKKDSKADANDLDIGKGIQSAAQASELGEMFQYTIATPVSLARQRSAMLPIVNDSVKADKVSIYNAAVHVKHPLSGLRLKNSTELHLLQGPITIFDGGAYAGDARIMDLPPGGERLVSYAVDLNTEVAPEGTGKPQQLVTVSLLKGLMTMTHKYSRGTTYTVKNSGDKKKIVLVEYPHDANWKLVAPKEPTEKTRNLYRFAVDAEPGKPAKLAVEEEQTVSSQVALTNTGDDYIRIFINAKEVSAEVKAALQEVIRRKQSLSNLAVKRGEMERQTNVIRQQQERIRENLKVLPKDSDLGRTYIKKFTEQEQQTDELQAQITNTVTQEAKERRDLDDYLLKLDLK